MATYGKTTTSRNGSTAARCASAGFPGPVGLLAEDDDGFADVPVGEGGGGKAMSKK